MPETLRSNEQMPVLFVGQRSPMNAIEDKGC
jgi:aromatic ring-opening dioxygenase catalytic subunit (LigB family)